MNLTLLKLKFTNGLSQFEYFSVLFGFVAVLFCFFRKGLLLRSSPSAGHSGMPFSSLSNSYGPESFYTSQPSDVQGGTFMKDPGLLITKQQCAN